jgi:ATP-dependent Clp protease protease subunit
MAAIILAGGAKNKRLSLPNSEIMIHQVMGGVEGQASDIKIRAEHILKVKSKLDKILNKHSNKTLSQIEKDTDRDYFMSPEEAMNYGLIDKIVK